METIVLLGAEDVRSAASTISAAASEMSRAASYSEDTARRQQQFMDDWLRRFEEAVNRLASLTTDRNAA